MKASTINITRRWLFDRCESDDGHLLWKLACHHGGPRGYAKDADGKDGQFAVRHAVWKVWYGEDVPHGMTVRPSCGMKRCLSKQCLEMVTHGGYNKGKPRTVTTRKKMAENARARVGCDPEAVQAIKAGGKEPKELAAELGVSLQTVYDVQSGRRWVDFGNPYIQLGAR